MWAKTIDCIKKATREVVGILRGYPGGVVKGHGVLGEIVHGLLWSGEWHADPPLRGVYC